MVRKNCDYNFCELLFALSLTNLRINTKNSILAIEYEDLEKEKIVISKNKFNKYIEDLKNRNPHKINEYVINAKKEINNYNLNNDIKKIYICGKTTNNMEIINLNKKVNKKKAKSDIYIKNINNNWIGISIKQNKKCQYTNYSVEKLFNICKINHNLKFIRLNYLKDNGFIKFDKKNRKEENKLFMKENPYFNEIDNIINNNNNIIKKKLVDNMFSIGIINYNLLLFDGTHLSSINDKKINYDNINFNKYNQYYYTKKGKQRKAAKLFYQLKIKDNTFRVEIRFKGNKFTSSVQFLIFNDI
jgi:hypothetical protein